MQRLIKQCIGIDISKLTFTACICFKYLSEHESASEVVEFKNNKQGYNQFVKWGRKYTDRSIPVVYVMEATGIYYEGLAYHLHNLKQPVSVVLPNKVKHFGKSLNIKTKTDIVDARIIAKLGVERFLDLWNPPSKIFKGLRDLTRLLSDLKNEKTAFSNRLEAFECGAESLPFIISATKNIIKGIDLQISKCEKEINTLLYSEEWLASKVDKLLSIKGVGLLTIAIILAETQGFKLIKNVKQLASYAGYDVVQRESGTSIKGKTRISKKGNGRIRAALHYPAMVSSRFNPQMKEDYQRIIANKPSKMVGITALSRKLLILIYTLWKKDEKYIEGYKQTTGDQESKSLLRHKNEVLENEVGRSSDLPTQDELPYDQSSEVLLRHNKVLKN